MKIKSTFTTGMLMTGMLSAVYLSSCQKNNIPVITPLSTSAHAPSSLSMSATFPYPTIGQGLVAYWPLFLNSTADLSGNHFDGKGHNIQPTVDRSGHEGGAYHFNGNSGYISVNNNALFNLTNVDFTLNAWVKDNANSTGGSNIIDERLGDTNTGWDWTINAGNAAVAPNALEFGSGPVTGNGVTALNTSSWHMVSAIYNYTGKQLCFYTDGVADDTISNITLPNAENTALLYIGRHKPSSNNGGYFNGAMSDVRIYNRALTVPELLGLYTSPSVQTNGIIAYWPFAGTGDDITGNNPAFSYFETSPASDRMGDPIGALGFTAQSRVQTPDNVALRLQNTDFTINFWAQNGNLLMSKISTAGQTTNGWEFEFKYSYQQAIFGTVNNANYIFISAKDSTLATPWMMVTAVYQLSSQTVSIYLNGVKKVSQGNVTPPGDSKNTPLVIHGDYHGKSGSTGSISDLRMYDRVLSPSEIQQLYLALN